MKSAVTLPTLQPLPFVRPRVVLSKCLEIEACRYNGQMIPNLWIRQLQEHVEFLPVCPEVEIGLGIPRDPIRIVMQAGQTRLVQSSSGRDLTEAMNGFAQSFLENLEEIDGFILKSRSPSCGIKDTKIYAEKPHQPSLGKSAGVFGGKVLERFPGLAIEDEGRLTNFKLREHFLTKLFLWARWRETKRAQSMKELVRFQSLNKILLMAYSQRGLKRLGRIVANPQKCGLSEVLQAYQAELQEVLAHPARVPSMINALMHALGYFSEVLSSPEKKFFLDTLEKYRAGKVPVSSLLTILRTWIYRFGQPYLSGQTLFEPYPETLIEIHDSGQGRNF